jgi:arylsulfatase A-like enzyme
MAEGLDWIRKQKDGPFFAFFPVTIPHAAMHVPEKYAKPFRAKFPEFEDITAQYGNNKPHSTNPAAQFAGMMTVLDESVGEILALLAELGLDDNTIVMISSDNGPHKEGGHLPDYINSNGGLRGYKRDLYEGGIRAPLLARWPGQVKAGTTSDLISAHWDLFPTCCELAGVEPPANLDGLSILPTLLGKEQKKHDYLYWEFHEQHGKRAIRAGNWKAVQLDMNRTPQPIELYDLKNDPAEQHNVAASHPAVVARLQQLMNAAHTDSHGYSFGRQR